MNLTNEQNQDLKFDLATIQRIERSLEHINGHVKEIDKNVQAVEIRLEGYNSVLKVNTSQLAEHMRRTAAAEQTLLLIEKKSEDKFQVLDGRMFTLLSAVVISLIGAVVAFTLRR